MGHKWRSTKGLWLVWAMTVGWIACGGATSVAHTQTEVVKMYPCPFASEEPTGTPQQRSVGSLIQALQGVGWKITALSPDLSSLSVRACAGGENSSDCALVGFSIAPNGMVTAHIDHSLRISDRMAGTVTRWLRNLEKTFNLGRCMIAPAAADFIRQVAP